jgi:hypothetical protein
MKFLDKIKEKIGAKKDKDPYSEERKKFKRKGKNTGPYTYEECLWMIKNLIIRGDAPRWVRQAVREKRSEIESNIKSPEQEMDEFMREMGGSPIAWKAEDEEY